jgi:hypothetical protein
MFVGLYVDIPQRMNEDSLDVKKEIFRLFSAFRLWRHAALENAIKFQNKCLHRSFEYFLPPQICCFSFRSFQIIISFIPNRRVITHRVVYTMWKNYYVQLYRFSTPSLLIYWWCLVRVFGAVEFWKNLTDWYLTDRVFVVSHIR